MPGELCGPAVADGPLSGERLRDDIWGHHMVTSDVRGHHLSVIIAAHHGLCLLEVGEDEWHRHLWSLLQVRCSVIIVTEARRSRTLSNKKDPATNSSSLLNLFKQQLLFNMKMKEVCFMHGTDCTTWIFKSAIFDVVSRAYFTILG